MSERMMSVFPRSVDTFGRGPTCPGAVYWQGTPHDETKHKTLKNDHAVMNLWRSSIRADLGDCLAVELLYFQCPTCGLVLPTSKEHGA